MILFKLQSWSFYGLILFWKIIELVFGLYVALDVSRIKDERTKLLTHFDETSVQLLSIYVTIIIFCIALPTYIFGPNDNQNFHYLAISIPTMIIPNIVLILNLAPRIWAVITGTEDQYALSPAKRIEAKIKKRLAGYSGDQTACSPRSNACSPRSFVPAKSPKSQSVQSKFKESVDSTTSNGNHVKTFKLGMTAMDREAREYDGVMSDSEGRSPNSSPKITPMTDLDIAV